MKLLFDQNLPPRLVVSLAACYPNSLHVRAIGLNKSSDSAIWDYAKQNGLTIVSKDSDFQQMSLLRGSPPKFIWLRVGNCTVDDIEDLLKHHSLSIHKFGENTEESHLMLP